eukprot:m.20965 g.20965  ORF g.20965 m.20965 type:complete len:58 (+) comp3885_c0_seq1:414-587(+)
MTNVKDMSAPELSSGSSTSLPTAPRSVPPISATPKSSSIATHAVAEYNNVQPHKNVL